jgi:hypothetical protein
MARRLWEHRKSVEFDGTLLVYAWFENVFQLMCCDDSGKLLLHIIEESDTMPDPASFTSGTSHSAIIEMKMDEPFHLLPKGFRETAIGDASDTQRIQLLTENLFLSHPVHPHKSFHAALPLYLISSEKAAGHEFYVYCWVMGHTCTIFYYHNGVCELANIYPAMNESEVLYYCMAAVKLSGADVSKVQFDILGENNQPLIQAFQRYIPNANTARTELPYPAGEYPPHASVSYLLYHYLTCELPVES